MLGVQANSEKNRGNSGEDKKLQNRNLRYLCPQAHDEGSRATDDEQAADDFAPTNVALFHEGIEHFRKGTSGWWSGLFVSRLRLKGRAYGFIIDDERRNRFDYDFVITGDKRSGYD